MNGRKIFINQLIKLHKTLHNIIKKNNFLNVHSNIYLAFQTLKNAILKFKNNFQVVSPNKTNIAHSLLREEKYFGTQVTSNTADNSQFIFRKKFFFSILKIFRTLFFIISQVLAVCMLLQFGG